MYQTKIIYRNSNGVNTVHSEQFPEISESGGMITALAITPAGGDKLFYLNPVDLEDIRSVQVTELPVRTNKQS